ncbi:MAG TPA: histidinol-phosphate transaminase [Bacteroidia bacterium]|jgi:histidinol-phosphate aminotransferase|nr:histidinol-phosphate transaminase [Bacteroidia bacterium]
MFNINILLRENIKKLTPYSSARDEYKGKEGVFLDANENAYGSPVGEEPGVRSYNRYPDPLQLPVKEKLSKIKGLPIENIFLGNGSDEAIDILFRAFCRPGIDNAIICPPTYGMYEVSAHINDVEVRKVNLLPETFQLDANNILKTTDEKTKLIFVCCPNNPTGNGVKWADIKIILEEFKGIVVVDEAYINFASYKSLVPELLNYPNLVILQTLSKAWGLAGLRIGMAFASQQIIDVFNKVKPPYNINVASQQIALEALDNIQQINEWIKVIVSEREILAKELGEITFVEKVYPSEANFLLVKVDDAHKIYNYLVQQKIVVRDRSRIILCESCLRITIGTKEENKKLLTTLKNYAA